MSQIELCFQIPAAKQKAVQRAFMQLQPEVLLLQKYYFDSRNQALAAAQMQLCLQTQQDAPSLIFDYFPFALQRRRIKSASPHLAQPLEELPLKYIPAVILQQLSTIDLKKVKNLGDKSIELVRKVLAKKGLNLKES